MYSITIANGRIYGVGVKDIVILLQYLHILHFSLYYSDNSGYFLKFYISVSWKRWACLVLLPYTLSIRTFSFELLYILSIFGIRSVSIWLVYASIVIVYEAVK